MPHRRGAGAGRSGLPNPILGALLFEGIDTFLSHGTLDSDEKILSSVRFSKTDADETGAK